MEKRLRHPKGIELTPTDLTAEALTREGEVATDSSDDRLKVRVEGDTQTIVTEKQSQTLENKDISADDNAISELEVNNLKSGVLNTSSTLSGATDAQIPSAKAVKDLVDTEAGELRTDVEALIDLSGVPAESVDLGTFSGSTIPDESTVKEAIQALETEVDSTEARVTQNEIDILDLQQNSAEGASSSTDNAIVRFDGATGKVLQNSSVTLDDNSNISGVNDLIGANELGASKIVAVTELGTTGIFTVESAEVITGSGEDVELVIPRKSVIKVNAPIDSIAKISYSGASVNEAKLTLTNVGPNRIVIKNSNDIITGIGKDLKLEPQASIDLYKTNSTWRIVGGTGAGAGGGSSLLNLLENPSFEDGVEDWVPLTGTTLTQERTVILPTINNENSMRAEFAVGTLTGKGFERIIDYSNVQYSGVEGHISFWTKTNLQDFEAELIVDGSVVETIKIEGNSRWTQHKQKVTMGSVDIGLRIINNGTSGTVSASYLYLDEVFMGAETEFVTPRLLDKGMSYAINENTNLTSIQNWNITKDGSCYNPTFSKTLGMSVICAGSVMGEGVTVSQDISNSKLLEYRAIDKTLSFYLEYDRVMRANITFSAYSVNSGGIATLIKEEEFENNTSNLSGDGTIVFSIPYTSFQIGSNSLRIEAKVSKTTSGDVAVAEIKQIKTYIDPMEYSPLIHEVKEESGMILQGTVPLSWNGTKGATTRDEFWCGREGQFLRVSYKYNNGSGGVAGTGNFRIPVPTECGEYKNLTVDLSLTPIVGTFNLYGTAGVHQNRSGSFRTNYGGDFFLFQDSVENAPIDSSIGVTLDDGYFQADALIPIAQWKQSTVAMSSQNDISNLDNHAFFGARIDSAFGSTGATISYQTYPWLTSCARSPDAGFDSIVCNTPVEESLSCVSTITSSSDSQRSSFAVSKSTGATSFGIRVQNQATSGGVSGSTGTSSVNIFCHKEGEGFEKAWKKTATAYLDAKYMKGLARYIVKTYQSGTDWYEVNNDCWVRQGGRFTYTGSAAIQTRSWLIPFASANNYTIALTFANTVANNAIYGNIGYHTRTTTGLTLVLASDLSKDYLAEGYGSKTAIQALGVDVSKCQ